MNKIVNCFFIFFIILLAFSGCINGERQEGFAFKLEPETYQFGDVKEGSTVDYTFIIKNIGTEVIKITDVRPTCGCTVADNWDKEILPGKKGNIPIVFNTQGFQGDVRKTIRVNTNIPDTDVIILNLEGTVTVPIQVDPRLLWLGEVIDETLPLKGNVQITNHLKKDLKLAKITPVNSATSAKLITNNPGQSFTLEVTVNPPFKEGNISETIQIITNSEEKDEVQVRYSYYLPEPIRVYPREIHVYREHLKNGLTRTITIQSRMDKPIVIEQAKVSHSALSFKIEESTPNKLTRILLTVPAGFEMTEHDTVFISFSVNGDPSGEEYVIPLKMIPQ